MTSQKSGNTFSKYIIRIRAISMLNMKSKGYMQIYFTFNHAVYLILGTLTFTVTTLKNPCCFPVFPEIFFSEIVSRFFPIGLQSPLSKTHVVSRFFPKKFSPKSFPGFSRSVYSDHFQKLMSFPGFSRNFL